VRHPFFDLPTPLVIGHRGAAGERPENTLPSFARALELGAVVLETDVHVSRDGHVVISHDPDVGRTTDGRGDLAELDLDAIRALDAGHRHTAPDGSHPFRGRGVHMPTLREAFEAFPGVRFNVELKRGDPRLVEGTLDAVEAFERAGLTLLAAEKDETMALLRERLRARGLPVAMGASTGDVVGFVRAAQAGAAPPPEPMALQIPEAFGGSPLVTPELVAFAHAHDVQVHVWTVNEADAMRRLLDLGVDGLVSDFPGRLREVVEARRRAGA
jgi:glycerophosphoryl diester phosphodiesterase